MDDFEDKIQKHDDGTEKLEGPVYWNAKAGLKSYQPMLAMFKSNMDDQFLVKIMEEQMEKAEKKYQEDLSEDNEAELEVSG